MFTATPPVRIDHVFEDPDAIRALVRARGPYRCVAGYLPDSATGGSTSGALPWFRGNWAANGVALVDGAQQILEHEKFADAAARLFGGARVTPTTVVVNVNAPMAAGAIHVDIPTFRGAGRDQYPLVLLQAMGASGLFERWRHVEAGAVTWLYQGNGGTYDYWPNGLDGPMTHVAAPFDNVALVADNDRMYHRIGSIGDPPRAPSELTSRAEILAIDGAWLIQDGDASAATYTDDEIRISILWKARVTARDAITDEDDALDARTIVAVFDEDLQQRGADVPRPSDPASDASWIERLHAVYYSAAAPG